MATAKATAAIENLDAVRCNGEWQEVPALVKKVERRAPGRSCLCLIAATEHAIQLKTLSTPNFTSPETRKALSDLLGPLQKEVSKYQLPLPKLPSPSGGGQRADVTPEDIFQAKVTIAWIHFLIGEYQAVLEKLPRDDETPRLTGAEGVGHEYTRVALVKAIVLRGLALEFIAAGDLTRALEVYKFTPRIPPPSIGLYTEWRIWVEKALGRFALVAHKLWVEAEERAKSLHSKRLSRTSGSSSQTDYEDEEDSGVSVDDYTALFAFRSYHKHLNSIQAYPSNRIKDMERGQVYRQYLKFISTLLSTNFSSRFEPSRLASSRATTKSYPSSLAGARQSTNTIGIVGGGLVGGIGITREELIEEIRSIQTIYESYFMSTINFPKADEVHVEVLEWVDLVMANWKRLGSMEEDAAAIVDILYRACSKTFHSPRILRHLFTTLTAIGKFKEAALALNPYIDLIGRGKERIMKGAVEKDFDDDSTIILTAVEGIRMLCKHLNDGKKAMEIARLIEKWLKEWGITCKDDQEHSMALAQSHEGAELPTVSIVEPEIIAAAWRGIGIANSYWARQTVEAAKRPEIQQSAEQAFRQGLAYDDGDVDGLFGLGMLLAETRNIDEAVEMVKRGLTVLNKLKDEGAELAEGPEETEAVEREYRRLAVPLWHLLALLLSASEEFDGALRVCDAVFEELGGEESLRRGPASASDVVDTNDPARYMIMKMGPDEKENILEVKMTYMALVELIEGPDVALDMADELLKLYTSLYTSHNLQGEIEKVQLIKQQQLQQQLKVLDVDDEKRSRMRPMSRYSRIGRSQHKKQTSSATALAVGSPRPTTSASTVTSRPKSSHTTGAPKIEVTDSAGTIRSRIDEPGSPDGKLHKRTIRANSVSGGTIRRRKSMGSVISSSSSLPQTVDSISQVPPIRANSKKVKRSPSLGSAPARGSGSASNVPPVPATPATPTRTHIFHLHKNVKSPSTSVNGTTPRSVSQQTDAPGIPMTAEGEGRMTTTSPQPLASSSSAGDLSHQAKPQSRPKRRLFSLSSRLPEPVLPENDERTKFLNCLRRVWLFISGVYRRGGFFDEALQAIDEAAKIPGGAQADVLVERGYLALAQGKNEEAMGHFENALGFDWGHPGGVVGLSEVIFGNAAEIGRVSGKKSTVSSSGSRNTGLVTLSGEKIVPVPNASEKAKGKGTIAPPNTSIVPSNSTTTPLDSTDSTSPNPTTATTKQDDDEEDLAPIIARNRAYGLLSQVTKSGRGWDCSEAWFELARSYEDSGQIEKARGVYWWCVGLEDSRPVRGWGGVEGGGVGLDGGSGWGVTGSAVAGGSGNGRGWAGRMI